VSLVRFQKAASSESPSIKKQCEIKKPFKNNNNRKKFKKMAESKIIVECLKVPGFIVKAYEMILIINLKLNFNYVNNRTSIYCRKGKILFKIKMKIPPL
jgi:hypothetical protein